MTYSSITLVRRVLSGFADTNQSTDPDFTAAVLSDTQIEYEIGNAESHIDIVLKRRYATPLPEPVPQVIKNLSTDMAAYLADMNFRGSREYASNLSPLIRRYERALSILEHIANGDYPLYNVGEGPEQIGDEAIVINPYKGDILLSTDVFPRGDSPDVVTGSGEYSVVPMRYRHYWSER